MTDYMMTKEELEKQPEAIEFMTAGAGGDAEVQNAMWSFWNFAHVFDDLIDESEWDKEKKEQAFKALHDFIQDLLVNPFVTRNAQSILAMMVSAITRNLDGDMMGESVDGKVRAMAPAVRCGDIDVILHMIYLRWGYVKLREFSKKREYDTKD